MIRWASATGASSKPSSVDSRRSQKSRRCTLCDSIIHMPVSGTSWWRPKLHDVQPCIVVGAVNQSLRVDEDVGRLNDAVAIDPMIDEARVGRRHQRANFLRPEWIADVEDAHAGILVG